MVWQDVFPISVSRIDAEEERELRLAAQARAGADWAFAALVARYQPPVTRYLTRLTGNPALARTLAERMFVSMERRVRGPHGGLHLRLWVLRACTEIGLDALRQPPHGHSVARLESPRPAGLLASHDTTSAQRTLRAGINALANLKGTTSRQVRKLIWYTPDSSNTNETTGDADSAQSQTPDADAMRSVEEIERMDPREALRYRMVRAVLAELPYGDAQCLALHLVAGLNQAEVAQALGIKHSATRKRIVHGLQLFAQRYEAAAISLGLSTDALAPTAEDFAEAPAALHGRDDVEEYLNIADEPTIDLRRPTVVTGSIAAVSPVIRTEDDDETSEAAAEAPHQAEEAPEESRAEVAVPSEPAHVFPAVQEVMVVPAPPTDDERETPFVVALAAQIVEVDVSPPEPPDLALVETSILSAPPIPSHADVRRVPILTAVNSDGEEPEPAAQSTPTTHISTARMVRTVQVLTPSAPAPEPAELPAPTGGIADADQTADVETAATEPEVRMAQTGTVRLVPVVTPIGSAADQRSTTPNEDLIATTPLRGNSGRHHGSGTNGTQDYGRTAGDAGDSDDAGPSMAHESRYEPKDASLAVTARIADDAGADR